MSARRSVTPITFRPLPARLIVAALLFLALFATRAPSAFAHAAFLNSTPEAGSRLRSSPPRILLRFTEPLNQSLSKATLVDAETGRHVATTKLTSSKSDELALGAVGQLPRAPYRVNWHTVSTVDGHALEGSFGFGVRTAAVGGEHQVQESPLARNGWVRIAFRTLFYAALFFFAGGVFNSLLQRRRKPAGWLVPPDVRSGLSLGGRDAGALAARAWARTLDAGWLAAGAAAATALAEAADAGGSLTLGNVNHYLLTNTAGLARVGTVIALGLAVLHANRHRLAAGGWTAVALMTIAISGHANSADPRAGAVLTDWIHLTAASVWIGGIAQIAVTWLAPIRRAPQDMRSAVMRTVLNRFGRVALPAFLVVAASGSVNALIELGHLQALWQTSYGRVLALKVALVGLVALASYLHALRIRPRILAANPHFPERLERRHWRLLSAEPLLAVCVVAAAAALVAFPLPPRQLGEAGNAEASAAAACNPCPLRTPGSDELAVADQAGSNIAAFWLRRSGDRLIGSVRLLDENVKPVDASLRLLGGKLDPCGVGCWRFDVSGAADPITVAIKEKGKEYRASVPTRWDLNGNREARRLTELAQRTMRGLRSLKEEERLTSGPGTYVRTLYRFRTPDTFTYRTSSGARSIVIGKRRWDRIAGQPWQAGPFGGLSAFRTRDFFRWTVYAREARLLRTYEQSGRRIAELALMDPATPVWYRLYVDLSTDRVRADRMVTGAHFMDRRYFAFNVPVRIAPPERSVRAR